MSDPLTAAALVGTARLGPDPTLTGTPVDDLVAQLGDLDRERALLLRAGALAIYREAGQLPTRLPDPLPDPAPTADLAVCSPRAADIVQILLKQYVSLLPEALDRLIAAGLRLPPELLPLVLDARLPEELRPALRSVLGRHGRWLARFKRAWAWAGEDPLPDGPDEDGGAMVAIWQEGTPAQRIAALARLRAVDPAQARAWIAAAWKQERADLRVEMLQTLTMHLAPDDEPLLEAALDDRVVRVRTAAAEVLVQLPDSAFVQRMIARSDAMLVGITAGALEIRIPGAKAFDGAWERDGLVREEPRGMSRGDWWLHQVVCQIPPSHWEAIGRGPADLVAAAGQSDRRDPLLEGWAIAAIRSGDRAWVAALWDHWLARDLPIPREICPGLVRYLLIAQVEDAARQMFAIPATMGYHYWERIVNAMPRPWSVAFGQAYLASLAAYLKQAGADEELDAQWRQTADAAALGLPPACFSALPTELTSHEESDQLSWSFRSWHGEWRTLAEIVALRQRIIADIPADNPHE